MNPTNAAQNNAVEALLSPEQREQVAQAGIAPGLLAALLQSFLNALLANLPNLIGSVPAAPARPVTPARK